MSFRSGDIICALATPVGQSAIAVVRLSGPNSWSLVKRLAPSLENKKTVSHQAVLSSLVDVSNNQVFDEALIVFFAMGRSYTGEESVEISTHGSMSVVSFLIQSLCSIGARIAEPGEFTFRAFMNDRLDLVQAEAVLNLIHSDSVEQAKESVRQLQGSSSKVLNNIEKNLLSVLGKIEAGIDFATEGIVLVENSELISTINKLDQEIGDILFESDKGRLLYQGINITLIGQPNVGKSSLLNCLLGHDRALVTEVAGTTRDLVDGHVFVNGIKVTFVDTAGLRITDDLVERLGIQKTKKAAQVSHWIFCVLDITNFETEIDLQDFDLDKVSLILNKCDLFSEDQVSNQVLLIKERYPNLEIILTSAKDEKITKERVLASIRSRFLVDQVSNQSMSIHSKQLEWLHIAQQSLKSASNDLIHNVGHELVSSDLRVALDSIQRTLGHHYDDQILDTIFAEFCIGK